MLHTTETSRKDDVLEKVRGLWASSMDESYPPEIRESYRLKAEALAFQHKINLLTQDQKTNAGLEPEWRTFRLYSLGTQFAQDYLSIAYTLKEHCSLRGGTAGYSEGWQVLELVGMPSDLGYFDLLLTTTLLAFGGRLEPKWDTGLAVDENIYRMRAAGLERGRIARMAWPERFDGHGPSYVDKSANKRVTAIFEREAAKRDASTEGLVGRGANVATYRKSYAEGFVNELWSRLSRMRRARGEQEHGLVLASAAEKVAEAYYERYPSRRPRPTTASAAPYRAPNADCQRCAQAKSGYCREHGWLRPKKVQERPWSGAGYAQGEAAARSVDLGSVGTARVGSTSGYREVEG